MIQFLEMGQAAQCAQAVLPVVYQSTTVFDAGTGTTPQPVLAPLAAGDKAAYGGQVINKGCQDLLLTISYLQGGDCDPCTTPDTLTVSTVDVTVPKDSSFPLPDGFITGVVGVLVDNAGVPVALAGDLTQTVRFYSAYTPACPACAVLVP